MDNEVIILLFIIVLFCVIVMKYKEGMDNSDNLNPQEKSNEQQGLITNLHTEMERLKIVLSPERIEMLNSEIQTLNDQTKTLRNNIPDEQLKKK